jgi:hypothetical protein
MTITELSPSVRQANRTLAYAIFAKYGHNPVQLINEIALALDAASARSEPRKERP